MKVLVTGSHRYQGPTKAVIDVLERHGITTLIHGNAPGVDKLCAQWGKQKGLIVRGYRADWWRYNLGAGPIRNQEMIYKEHEHRGCSHAVCDGPIELGLAFPDGYSSGTWDMVERLRLAGIPHEVTFL